MREHAGKGGGVAAEILNAADGAEVFLDPFAHHGLRRRPHIEMGIERAADAFDHDHGFLEHDEFGAGAHIEQAGNLEEEGEEFRHGNLVGRALVDRLANGADGLGEIIDRMAGGDVTRFEMDFGDAAVIAGDEAEQNFREETALLEAQTAHYAEIDGAEAAIFVDEQIAGVHIGVEKAVAQGLAQEGLDDGAAKGDAVMAFGDDGIDIVQRGAVDPFHGENFTRGQIPIDGGDAEIRVVAGVFRHFGQSGGFETEIHLHGHGARERFDDIDEFQAAGLGGERFEESRGIGHGAEIAAEAIADIGAQDFDRHGLALKGGGAMHLRDGGGGDGLAEFGKNLIERLAECGLYRVDRIRLGEGGNAILQTFEIAGDADADDVGACGHELAEFDVGRAEAGECGDEALGAVGGAAAFDEAGNADQGADGRGRFVRVNEREGAFAGEDKADAGKAEKLEGGNGDHGRTYTFQPE